MKLFRIKKYSQRQQGFTLIEILIGVVISVIIGVAVTQAIFQTYSTFSRNTARSEANSQVVLATKYIHQDAQSSNIVYRYDTDSTEWIPVDYDPDDENHIYNLVDEPFLLERPFWEGTSYEGVVYYFECYVYEIDSDTGELKRSHYYYNDNVSSISSSSPDSVITIARDINTDDTLVDSLGNPINYWCVDSRLEYPNGMYFTAQITCTAGTSYPQTVTGKVDVIRMMVW